MRHARGLITPTEALRYVFNVSVKVPYRPAVSAGLQTTFTSPRRQQSSTSTNFRPLQFDTPDLASRLSRRPDKQSHSPFRAREVDPSKFGPKDLDRPQRDEEIQARRAYTRMPDKKLSEPHMFQDLLDGRARDERGRYTQFLQQLAPPDPGNGRPYPIVAYYDKLEMKSRELAHKKAAKVTKIKEKALELGWSIEERDLQQRLSRLKEFLEKGSKVEMILGSSRIRGWANKKKMSEEEGLALVERIRAAALEVPGTKEMGKLTGHLLGLMRLTFQGPSKKEREKESE